MFIHFRFFPAATELPKRFVSAGWAAPRLPWQRADRVIWFVLPSRIRWSAKIHDAEQQAQLVSSSQVTGPPVWKPSCTFLFPSYWRPFVLQRLLLLPSFMYLHISTWADFSTRALAQCDSAHINFIINCSVKLVVLLLHERRTVNPANKTASHHPWVLGNVGLSPFALSVHC